jgi:hypothetical protein
MDGETLSGGSAGAFQEERGGAEDEVFRIDRQGRIAAGQAQAGSSALELQPVAHLDRVHDRFQFVIAVRPSGQDVEQKIDFAA